MYFKPLATGLLALISIALLTGIYGCKKKIVIPVTPVTITAINPASGSAGTSVTITGTNFDPVIANNTVNFNGAAATITGATSTQLVVTAPAGGSTGAITVTNSNGTAKSPVFTYVSLKPTITAINPASGSAGTSVTITGTNFDPVIANNTVNFNGAAATITGATSTKLVVTAPAGGSTGAITVTNSNGTATSPVFTYVSLKPTITSISPVSGLAGTAVTITGTNFDPVIANNTVNFNGAAATITGATATTLKVLAPAGGSTGAVKVTTAAGTATGPIFTYTTPVHDVYVLGQTASGFCYWKNGVRTDLPANANTTNSYMTSIFVAGTDVYVGGSSGNSSGGSVPTYWKNGTTSVSLPITGPLGAIASIYVSGSNVYAVGSSWASTIGQYALLSWVNGTASYLLNSAGTPGATGLVAGMAVNGSDIYISGNISTNSGNNINAAYWKNNGVPTVLTSVTSASANGIYLSGSDLYLAGAESGICKYWKNGAATLLSPNANGLRPGRIIYVLGSDVYVAGQANGAAKYWKNGSMVGLTTQESNNGIATCIHGVNNDIYIGGSADGNNNVWGYWVNGTFVTLSGCTGVVDIFVK